MRRKTTTQKLHEAISNGLLKIEKAEVYNKTFRKTETIDAESFYENFQFLCESGCFIERIVWHFKKDYKTNGYLIETGRMDGNSDIIITTYLSVADGVNVEDIDTALLAMEE